MRIEAFDGVVMVPRIALEWREWLVGLAKKRGGSKLTPVQKAEHFEGDTLILHHNSTGIVRGMFPY